MLKSQIVRLALWSFDHAKLFFVLLLVLLGCTFWAMKGLQFDMSQEAALRKTNPVRVTYNDFKKQFGRDDFVLILADVESAKQKGVPLAGVLDKLDALKTDIEQNVSHVEEVNGLTNVRYTYSQEGALRVDELLPLYKSQYWRSDAAFLDFVAQHPLYKNRFISEDKKYIALTVEFKSHASDAVFDAAMGASDIDMDMMDLDAFELSESAIPSDSTAPSTSQSTSQSTSPKTPRQKVDTLMMAGAMDELKAVVKNAGLDTHVTGSPYIVDELSRLTNLGSARTGGIAMVITLFLLMFFFRRLSAVWIPLTIVPLSMLYPLGLKALADMPYTMYSGIVAPLMIAIGVADAVHILSRFYEKYDETGNKRTATQYAVETTGNAILLTSVTTALGFISFVFGDLEAISNLGIYAAAAVMTAFFLSIMFLPACLGLFKIKRRQPVARTADGNGTIERILSAMLGFSLRHRVVVSVLSVLAVGGLVYNLQNIQFSYNMANDLSPGVIRSDYHKINGVFKTVNPVEVVVDSGTENGALSLPLLQAVEAAEAELGETRIDGVYISKPYSVTSIVKEVHMALNDNQPAFYTLPNDENTIKQELSLFESSARDDLFESVDERFQKLRINMQVEDADSSQYFTMLQKVQAVLEKHIGDKATITITGNTALSANVLEKISTTMTKSYAVSFLTITVLLIILIKSIRIGLISMLPNLLPILIVMNVMIALGWPVDLTTILIGVIAIGIVVDDTLHILHRYKENRNSGATVEQSFMQIVPTTGKALLTTTILYACAAFNNVFSPIPGFITFGIALSAVTVLALISDLIVLPALVATLTKNKVKA